MNNWFSKQVLCWSVAGVILVGTGTVTALQFLGQRESAATPTNAPTGPGAKKNLGNSPGSTPGPSAKKVPLPIIDPVEKTISHPAHVLPYEQTHLFAKVSGYLEVIHVDIGDEVEEGQELAVLWIPELEKEKLQKEALVEQAEAEQAQADAAWRAAESLVKAVEAKHKEAQKQLNKLQSEVDFYESEYQRFHKLNQSGAIDKALVEERFKKLQAARAGYESGLAAVESAQANIEVEKARAIKAKADVQSAAAHQKVAQANLNLIETTLAFGIIKAPYKGVITRRLVHTGAFIQSAANGKPEPLLTILRTDKLRIVTDIPAGDAASVKVGQPATLKVNGIKEPLTGKVCRTARSLDVSTRTLRTEIELEQFPPALQPGMFGYVSIAVFAEADQ